MLISLTWVTQWFGTAVCVTACILTEFVSEGKTLHHALVHQRLFGSAVRDQPDALGLKLILSSNYRSHDYCKLFETRACVLLQVFTLYLQVQTCCYGLIHYDVSMFECRELAEWNQCFVFSWCILPTVERQHIFVMENVIFDDINWR